MTQRITGHLVADAIARISFEGNITPGSWYKHICYRTSRNDEKCDRLAIAILADIVNHFWVKDTFGDLLAWDIDSQVQDFVIYGSANQIRGWADIFVSSEKVVRESLNRLSECGMLHKLPTLSAEKARNVVCSKPVNQGLSLYENSCSWCNCRTAILHAHHYPITQKNGGTQTVDICPNCHAEFHWLIDVPRYRLTDLTIDSCKALIGGGVAHE